MMVFYGKSDIGLVRKTNQDSFYIDKKNKWIVVADGMGGHNGGETASKLAVDTITEVMNESKDLKIAIEKANEEIYDLSIKEPSLTGMGTTVVLCSIDNERVNIAHVGDSRAYLINEKGLHRITTDHSVVQQLLDSGSITEEEAKNHPQRNLITRAVGTDKIVMIDFNKLTYEKNNYILVCSDGLTTYTDEEDIHNIIKANTPEKAVDKLVEKAIENGGQDNITVVLIRM